MPGDVRPRPARGPGLTGFRSGNANAGNQGLQTFEAGLPPVRASCLSYSGRMTATTISFRANEQTMAELRQLAGDGNLSDAIRELIHAQYTARLYAQAARDAERLRNDPADLAEIKALNEELDEISAW